MAVLSRTPPPQKPMTFARALGYCVFSFLVSAGTATFAYGIWFQSLVLEPAVKRGDVPRVIGDYEGEITFLAGVIAAAITIGVGRWVARKYQRCPLWYLLLFGMTLPFFFMPSYGAFLGWKY